MQDDDEREEAYRHNLNEAQERLERLREEEGDPLLIQQAEEDVGYYSSRIGTTRSDLIIEGAVGLGTDALAAGLLRGLVSVLPRSVSGAIIDSRRSITESDGRILMDPADIRFSQDSVSPTFKDGKSLSETIEALRSGTLSPRDLPAIKVTDIDGQLYSLDNRRLLATAEAGTYVATTRATAAEVAAQAFKFTSKNNGCIVCIRGGK
jgi:hypothetical protein